MAMVNTDNAPTQPEDEIASFYYARTFDVTNIKTDITRWNKDWEKVLKKLASKDVYSTLGVMWRPRGDWNEEKMASEVRTIEDTTRRVQQAFAKTWDTLEEKGHFVTPWLLLNEDERKRHLLSGLEDACRKASWSQDARAMCPDITLRALLKFKGNAFIEFAAKYREGIRGLTAGSVYLVPNHWWQETIDTSEASVPGANTRFARLTTQRNEFICKFSFV